MHVYDLLQGSFGNYLMHLSEHLYWKVAYHFKNVPNELAKSSSMYQKVEKRYTPAPKTDTNLPYFSNLNTNLKVL